MIINKNSWHYRLNVKLADYEWQVKNKKSLCSYFWYTMFNLLLKVPLILLGIVLAVVIVTAGVFLLASPLLNYIWAMPVDAVSTGKIMWVIFSIGASLIFGLTKFFRWKENRRKVYKADGLVMSFIKAKKAKVCPLVEFK